MSIRDPIRPLDKAIVDAEPTTVVYPKELIVDFTTGDLYIVKSDLSRIFVPNAAGKLAGTLKVICGTTSIMAKTNLNTDVQLDLVSLLSNNAAEPAGTASAGDDDKAARADHVHPAQTDITGNAGTATKLQTGRGISITGGATAASVTFDGSGPIALSVTKIDGTKIEGKIDPSCLPEISKIIVVHVANQAARFALTKEQVQNGDFVVQDDTNVMYIVTNDNALDSEAGYTPLATSTAVTAQRFATDATVALTGDVTGSVASKHGWTVATTLANSGATAGTYGETADKTLDADGATLLVPCVTVDAKGRVTSIKEITSTHNDRRVYLGYKSTNGTFPLVFDDTSDISSVSDRGATQASVNNVFYVNPSTGAMYATKFVGDGSDLTGVLHEHPTVVIEADTSSTATPGHGDTFTVIDSVTRDTYGHVNKLNVKTVTLPAGYVHPSYTAQSSGFYKVTVDNKGHVSSVTAVSKEDVTNLGIVSDIKIAGETESLISSITKEATIPKATALAYGVTKLDNTISTATDKAATPATVKTAKDRADAAYTLAEGKQDPATTLAGYGITDAHITNGTVTLGTNTITPVVESSTGKISQTAAKATVLETARGFQISGGATAASVNFDGSGNVNLNVTSLDATKVTGVLPLETIPKGAKERLIHVANQAARFALTKEQVQNGDLVCQDDTSKLYYVKDDEHLDSEAGYEEFKVGTSAHAVTADRFASDAAVTLTGDVTGTVSSKHGWSLATTLANSGATAGSYGEANAKSLDGTSTANTFNLPYVTVDAKGRVTDIANKTITVNDKHFDINEKTDNASFPLLFDNTSGIAASGTKSGHFAGYNNAFYLNPTTGTLYATKFNGDGADLTNVVHTETQLSKVDTGSGNVISGISVSDHAITISRIQALTEHPTIAVDTDTTSTAAPGSGGTFTAIDSVTRDSNGHVTKVNTKTVTMPTVPSISVSDTSTGDFISSLTASGHTITITKGSQTQLSKEVSTASPYVADGNVISDIDVSNHKITLKKINALTAHPAITISDNTTSTAAPGYGGTFTAIDSVTKDANGHVTKINTKTVTMPSAKVITINDDEDGTFITEMTTREHTINIYRSDLTASPDATTGNVLSGISVNGATITYSRITALTAHPTIAVDTDTTSTSSPGYGGTFEAVDTVTRDANGHVTKINTKTVTMPAAQTIPDITVSDTGTANVISDITATGHTLTVTRLQALTAHPTIPVTKDTTSASSPGYGGTFEAVDTVTRDANGHVININTKTVTMPSAQEIPGVPDITISDTGTNTFITGMTANKHTITVSRSNLVVSDQETGNVVSDINVSGATITLNRITALTAHPSIAVQADTTSADILVHGGTFTAVDSVTREANGHVVKINTKTYSLPTGYVHPSFDDQNSGFYKFSVSGGHVQTVTAVTKSDITALGIPGDVKIADSSTSLIDSTTKEAIIPKASSAAYGVVKFATAIGVSTNLAATPALVKTAKDRADEAYTLADSKQSPATTLAGYGITDAKIAAGVITLGENTITPLTEHPTISVTTDTTSATSPGYSGTFTAVDSVTRDANGHVTKINLKTVTMPAEQTLPSVPDITVTDTETGNVVSDISASGHNLTISRITALTAHPAIPTSADTTSEATLVHGGTFTAITSATREGNGHVTTLNTTTYTLPAAYVHPSYTSRTKKLYKVAVDATGHVNDVTEVVKADITGLLGNYTVDVKIADSATSLLDTDKVAIIPKATSSAFGVVQFATAIGTSTNTAATPALVKTAKDRADEAYTLANGKQDPATTLAGYGITDAKIANGVITLGSNSITPVVESSTGKISQTAAKATALETSRSFQISGGATAAGVSFNGTGDVNLVITSLDATKVTGVLPLESIPPSARERMVSVANQAARFALTTDDVQNGDVVYQEDTKVMYYVIDDTSLSSEAGYKPFSAGIASHSVTTDAFKTAATVTLTGDVTGTVSSTKDWSIATTLANSGATAGSYGEANAKTLDGLNTTSFSSPYITVDAKGRVTSIANKTITVTDRHIDINAKSDNKNYPLIFTNTDGISGTGTKSGSLGGYNNVFYVNPSTGALYATKFEGSGADLTGVVHSETSLSKGTTTGSGNVVTDIAVSGHTITLTKGITALTAHPTITVDDDTSSTASPGYSGTFTAVDSVTRDANGHVTKLNLKTVTMPAAQTIPTIPDITVSDTGTENVVADITASGHTITVSRIQALTAHPSTGTSTDTTATGTLSHGGTFTAITTATRDTYGHVKTLKTTTYTLPSETSLSKGTATGSGNVVTDLSVSGHTITLTKGITALTAHPTISTSTDTSSTASPGSGGTFTVVDSVTRETNGHVTKINTKTVTMPTVPTIPSITISDTGTANVISGISASGHTITVTRITALTAHPSTSTSSDTTGTASPSFGGTFTAVATVTRDTYGHVKTLKTNTITIPSTAASSSAAGLVTTGTQTMAGAKTFSTSVSTPSLTVSTAGNATGISKKYTGTVTASGTWTASGDDFYQNISISNLPYGDNYSVVMDINFSSVTSGTESDVETAYGKIYRATVTAAGNLRVYVHEKPETDVPIMMYVIK